MWKTFYLFYLFSQLLTFFIERLLIAESILDSDITRIKDEDLNDDKYILGSGDLIKLTLFEAEELPGQYIISLMVI